MTAARTTTKRTPAPTQTLAEKLSKPFCDDANSFWSLAKIPAITHGPSAGGAHTLEEWVSIDDLVRVAQVYVLTALGYCGE